MSFLHYQRVPLQQDSEQEQEHFLLYHKSALEQYMRQSTSKENPKEARSFNMKEEILSYHTAN